MIDSVLIIIARSLEMMPGYSQRKREKFYKLSKGYMSETSKSIEFRDSKVIDDLYDELHLFVRAFAKEIGEQNSTPLPGVGPTEVSE